ncbi:MAG TPA: helix-turn-helix domain-containing protein [Candidatus Limnocylindria bacterium]|nr:helix-turn-helix domain-containing protein [Candidatus Limnocylindria bacterium]
MPTQREQNLDALSLLDEPTRRRLYDWVVGQGRPVGREEAAKALKLTRALATFHLDRLAEAGLLESGYRRLSGKVGPGAGRPARVYWRADREFSVSLPDRRYERAAQLFAAALEHMSPQSLPPTLRDVAHHLGRELGSASRRGRPERRLAAALAAGGYEPVADETGTIRLRNCPFDALVDSHRPLVCGTNLAVAEGLASGAGVTNMRPVLDPQPGYCCVAFVPNRQREAHERGSATNGGPVPA